MGRITGRLLKRPSRELFRMADDIRREHAGKRFELCSITNAKSGLCGEDCKFCAQSARYKTEITSYPLKDKETLLKEAGRAKALGAVRFGIVTSGNRLRREETESVADAVRAIRRRVRIEVCASLGSLAEDELRYLKEAGLTVYHHNIETSPRYYPQVVSTHEFRQRLETIESAMRAGLKVCSGGILGMGETERDRIEMAYILKELAVDSVPLNILVPIKGTPLEHAEGISPFEVLRTIAIFRLILKDKSIKIAAGRENNLADYQALAFLAGADGMLIGGYLTRRGREASRDRELVGNIRRLWSH